MLRYCPSTELFDMLPLQPDNRVVRVVTASGPGAIRVPGIYGIKYNVFSFLLYHKITWLKKGGLVT